MIVIKETGDVVEEMYLEREEGDRMFLLSIGIAIISNMLES